MATNIEQSKEYARIIKDTPYALRTYLQTFDNTQKRNVPLDLVPDQISLINDYENYNITKRQLGGSPEYRDWPRPNEPKRLIHNRPKCII